MTRPVPDYSVAALESQPEADFTEFSNEQAADLGMIAVGVIRDWGLNLAMDIVLDGDLVFRAKLGTTGKGNDEWLAGKAAAALHFGEPSLLVRLRHREAGTSFDDVDVDHTVVRAHGGSIPLKVNGVIVGTLTMSGEPDAIDHEAATEAIRRYRASLDSIAH